MWRLWMAGVRERLMSVIGAIIGAISLGIADMLMKSGRWVQGSTLYLLSAVPAYMAFQSPSYRLIFNVWACAAIAFTLIVSIAYYHEPMTYKKYIASALILAAMILEN